MPPYQFEPNTKFAAIWFYAYGKPRETIAMEGSCVQVVYYHQDMKPPEIP